MVAGVCAMAETTPPKSIAITKKYRVKKRTVIESVPVNSTDMGKGNNFWKTGQERLLCGSFGSFPSLRRVHTLVAKGLPTIAALRLAGKDVPGKLNIASNKAVCSMKGNNRICGPLRATNPVVSAPVVGCLLGTACVKKWEAPDGKLCCTS